MKTKHFPKVNETIVEATLANKLPVTAIHKPGFAKSFVALSVPIGAMHQQYINAQGNTVKTQKGVAHFLEHKVFEKDGQDISQAFSLQEAQINAFTEHHQTTYIFHATDHLHDHIVRLLNMVFHPSFTEAGVKKEKNIILEELNMHLDDPYYLQYQTTLQNLYHDHPIKDDILGDEDSIKAMSLTELKAMHAAYYTPEAAQLIIISATDPATIIDRLEHEAQTMLPHTSTVQGVPFAYQEPPHVRTSHTTLELDIKTSSLLVGIKITPRHPNNPTAMTKDKFALSILFNLLFSPSSNTYQTWLTEGLINESFGLDVAYEKAYAYILLGSETTDPTILKTKIIDVVLNTTAADLDQTAFERQKRQMIGNFISGLDHLEHLSYHFNETLKHGLYLYDVLDLAMNISFDDVKAQLNRIKAEHITATISVKKTN